MRSVVLLAACLGACAPKFNWPEFRFSPTLRSERFVGINAALADSVDTLVFDVQGDRVSAKLTRYRRVKVFTQAGAQAAEVRLPFSARMKLVEFDGRGFRPFGEGYRTTKARLGKVTIRRPLIEEGIREYGEVVMTIPGIEPGNVFDYFAIYEIPDAMLLDPIMLRDRMPAERAELIIVTPKDADFDLRFLEGGTSKAQAPTPAPAPTPQQTAYRFVLRDLPALIPEEGMPAPARIGPAVWPLYRGMRGGRPGPKMERWHHVLGWLRSKYQLTANGEDTDPEKLQAAFAAEAKGIAVIDNHLRLGEHKIGAGDDRVAAGLRLYDALATRGFKVGVGLVARETSGLVLPEAPSPAPFDAVVAVVPVSGKLIYLDPACPSCPLDRVSDALEGAQVVALSEEGARIETLPMRESNDNAFSLTVALKLGLKGEVTGSAQAVMAGAPAAMARAAYQKKDTQRLLRELGMLESLPVSNLRSPESERAAQTFELSFDVSAQCKEEGPARMLCGVDVLLEKLLPDLWREARTQDLLIPSTYQHTAVVTVQIPTKARVVPPSSASAQSRFGSYSLQYQTQPGQLAVTRRFVLSARRVPAAEYEAFHGFLSQARHHDETSPVIELFAEEPAPINEEPKAQDKHDKGKKGKRK